uniref:Reverse transcriptase domain-containing protein n=1 Tax=Schizaphis graminum TaxID=13262 RepID=A0A2S2NSE5_SCHGA
MAIQVPVKNSLSQGYVLSLILFNVYPSDIDGIIVNTISRKFMYSNDIALVAQIKDLTMVEDILNQDLINLQHYFTKWNLIICPSLVYCFIQPHLILILHNP